MAISIPAFACIYRTNTGRTSTLNLRNYVRVPSRTYAKADLGATLDALGEVYRMRGMWDEAVQAHKEAIQVWRELAEMQKGD